MMLGVKCFLFILMVTYVNAMSSLSRIPLPMSGYQQHRAYGQWYSIYYTLPCAMPRGSNILNYNNINSSGGKNALKLQISWQNGEFCNTVTAKKSMVSPGVYLTEDDFGDRISGKYIVAFTDYTRSYILWTCTKSSAFRDMCEEPFVIVRARTPNPDPLTIALINTKLKSVFGITVNDLLKVTQTGACYLCERHETFFKGK